MTVNEVATALWGAFRLARFDPGGMRFFDATQRGFWRSFYAAAIVAPFYGILLILRYATGTIDAPPLRFLLVEAIAYVVAWVIFPLVMESLARMLKREDRYLGYIVAYNWAGVLQNLLYLPMAMLTVSGVLPRDMASLLGLIVLGLILAYVWFVTRTALDVPAGTATGLVILDLTLSIFVNMVADSLL